MRYSCLCGLHVHDEYKTLINLHCSNNVISGTRIILLPLQFLITSEEDVKLLPTDKLTKISICT